jgi:hypothetical protein
MCVAACDLETKLLEVRHMYVKAELLLPLALPNSVLKPGRF